MGIRRLRLAFFLVCSAGVSLYAGDILKSEKKLYSQFDEELIIRDFFNDRRGGVFVDVGAAKYKQRSTTYYLEKHLDWGGIAVDALKGYEADYLKYRPKTRFYAYVVTDADGQEATFYFLKRRPTASSLHKEILDEYAKTVPGIDYTELRLPTITLNKLLEDGGLTKIDFLSMDIEGSEPQALSGFDIRRFRPELVMVERLFNEEQIRAYFAHNGYELIEEYLPHDEHNYYFRPKPAER